MASMELSTRACASGVVEQPHIRTPGHVPGIERMQVEFRRTSSSIRKYVSMILPTAQFA